MESGFRSHDRDRTSESMKGFCWASGLIWRGAGLEREGVSGYAVNRWGIKRPPNGTKFDGRSVGAIPRPHGKSRSIPRTFYSRSRKENRGVQRARARVSDRETDNGEKDRMQVLKNMMMQCR